MAKNISQEVLEDFLATVAKNPNVEREKLLEAFPEFENDQKTLDAAFDYRQTRIDNPNVPVSEVNLKFPEFFGTPQPQQQEQPPSILRNSRGANAFVPYMGQVSQKWENAESDREGRMRMEDAATLPLSDADVERQAQIDRLTKTGAYFNEEELARLEGEKPSYLTREVKTPQDVYDNTMEAWSANTDEGRAAKEKYDREMEGVRNGLNKEFERRAAIIQESLDNGTITPEEAERRMQQLDKDKTDVYNAEDEMKKAELFNAMTTANEPYIRKQLRVLGQKAVNTQTQLQLNTINPLVKKMQDEIRLESVSTGGMYGSLGKQMGESTSQQRNEKRRNLQLLKGAQKYLNDAAEISIAAQNGQGLGKGFVNAVTDEDTWDMGIAQLVRSSDLKNIVEKYEKDPQSITDEEKAFLDAAVTYISACAYNSDRLSRAYKAGQTTGESIPFMLQFALMPIEGIKSGVVRGLLGYGVEQMGGKALQAGAKYTAGVAAKEAGAMLAGNLVAAGAQTMAFGAPKVAEGTISRMTGDIVPTYDANGQLVYGGRQNQQSGGQAFRNALVDAYVENLSEMIFTTADPLKAFVKGTKLFAGMEKSQLAAALAKIHKSPIGRIGERMQFRNYPEEVAEEYVGNLLKWGLSSDIHSAEEAGLDPDAQIDLWLGLAPTSLFFAGAGALHAGGEYVLGKYESSQAAKKLRSIMEDGEERKYFERLLKAGNSADFAAASHDVVKSILQDDNISEDYKREILGSIFDTYKAQLASETQEIEQSIQERDPIPAAEQREPQQPQETKRMQMRKEVEQEMIPQLALIAFKSGGEEENMPIFHVTDPANPERKGYVVAGETVPIVETREDAEKPFIFSNGDAVVTVMWDGEETPQMLALKKLDVDGTSDMDTRIEEETDRRMLIADGMEKFAAGDKVQWSYIDPADGTEKVADTEVLNVTDEGVEIAFQMPNGEEETTIVDFPTAMNKLQVVEKAQPQQEEPIVPEPEPEPQEPEVVEPNIDTMSPAELGAAVVEYIGDKQSAKAYLQSELNKAKAALRAVANKQVGNYTSIADWKQQNDAIMAQKKAAQERVSKLEAAINEAEAYKTAAERAAAEEAEAKRRAEYESRRRTESAAAGSTPAEKWNSIARTVGNSVTRTLADGTKITGHYVLAEAGTATPSHDPMNGWNTSEGFPVTQDNRNINDRDYKNDKDARDITEQIARTYDGQAVEQVPVVSNEGIVYDGNGRTIAGNIAAANNTDAAYLEALRENSANFGFTQEQLAQYQHPRVYMQLDENLPYSTTTFAKFNQQEKKTQGSTNRAVANSKKLTESARDGLLEILEEYGTLDTFFASEKGANEVVKSLLDNGIITQQEVAGLTERTDGGYVLSPAGKDYITDLLIGALFDEQTIRMLGNDKGLKQSILRALPSIVENRKLGDYALTENIRGAIRLLYEARQAGMAYNLYVLQGNAFDGYVKDRFSAFDMLLAEEMSAGVEQFRQVLNMYNNSARDEANGQGGLFEVRTADDIKNEILDYYGRKDNQPAKEGVAGEETEPAVPSAQAGNGGQDRSAERVKTADAERGQGIATSAKQNENNAENPLPSEKKVVSLQQNGKATSKEEYRQQLADYLEGIKDADHQPYLCDNSTLVEAMKAAGASAKDVAKAQNVLSEGGHIEGFYLNGYVILNVDELNDFEKARSKYVHERQHDLTRKDIKRVQEVMKAASEQELKDILFAYTGHHIYDESSYAAAADEFISFSMEEAYKADTDEELENALKGLGVKDELINIIKSINDEQRRNQSFALARRHAPVNQGAENRAAESGGNSKASSQGNIRQGGSNTNQPSLRRAESGRSGVSESPIDDEQRNVSQSDVSDVETGGALVEQLERMGVEVSTDLDANREALKAAKADKSDAGTIHYYKTRSGQQYGFSYKGKIYLDPRKVDANLPMHEYAHLWCDAFRRLNPQGWRNIIETIKADSDSWNFVKQQRPDLKTDDEIADEVIATFSGTRGAEKLKAELERMAAKDPRYTSKWRNIFKNISKAIQDFWKAVGDFLHIQYTNAAQVYDQVLKDFVDNMNPRKRVNDYLRQRNEAYMRAAEAGDTQTATAIFNEALRENIGNGITPYISAGNYNQLRRLAKGVKTRDAAVIREAAELIAPLIPENAVLVPAPSHIGKATDMLDLVNAIAEITGSDVADILTSAPRTSQYQQKKETGVPTSSQDLGITANGTVPEGKVPVVIDNVVDSGNTAEACVRALGKGVVVSLANSAPAYGHAASLKSAAPIVKDKNGNIIPLDKRFDLSGSKYLGRIAPQDVRFSISGTGVVKLGNNTLVGLHNISAAKLRRALKQGGLANPSAAVIDIARQNHENYGEVSLVMPSRLVDSETGRNAGTFTGDIWSPTYPSVSRQMSDKGYDKYHAALDKAFDGNDARQPIKSRVGLDYNEWLDRDDVRAGLAYWYLLEKGIDPGDVYFQSDVPEEIKKKFAPLADKHLLDYTDEERMQLLSLIAKMKGTTAEDYLQSAQEDKKRFQERIEDPEEKPFKKNILQKAIDEIDTYGVRYHLLSDGYYAIDNARKKDGKINVESSLINAQDKVQQEYQDDFDKWVSDLENRFNIREVIFDGYTRSGNRIYRPNTLDVVSRLMNKESLQNAGSHGGLSATRGQLMERMRTLSKIRANKSLLRSLSDEASEKEEWEKMSNEWFATILNPLSDMQKIDSNPFINVSYAEQRLLEALQEKDPISYLNKEYGYHIAKESAWAKNLSDMLERIKKMPSRYFETKFRRPVYLNEFAAAVVPNDLAEDLKSGLTASGLPLYEYDRNVAGSRREATLQATDDESIRFSISGHGKWNTTPDAEREMNDIKEQAIKDGTFMQAPNGKPSKLNERQWLQVRTRAFKRWFGDWESGEQKAARIEKLRKSEPILLSGKEFELSEDLKQAKKNAFEYGKTLQGYYINSDTGHRIQLQRGRHNGGVNEVLQHNYKDIAHLQSVAAIPQIIEKSIFIANEPNSDREKNPTVASYDHYVCGLKIGNVEYTVHALVAVDSHGDRYYDHNLVQIEKEKLLEEIQQATSNRDFGTTPDTKSTISNSDRKGTKLFSILQENSQKNADFSQILDENGEPLVVFHRTWANFTTFDKDKIGSSTDIGAFGQGFYFSPDDFILYGDKRLELFINARNPMNLNDGNAYDIKQAYVTENGEFDKAAAKRMTDDLQSKGYDSVVYTPKYGRMEIVAFEPNQIKSATDNDGSFSEDNDDIRFSISNANNDIFYSNAERAVETIKQEKATPEQWRAMIEKNGGLKAGEDKWIGLSDWLNEQRTAGIEPKRADETMADFAKRVAEHKVTLTKQQVLDYIRANKIQIEEVPYSKADNWENNPRMIALREEFDELVAAATAERDRAWEEDDEEAQETYARPADVAFDELVERYGDDFTIGFEWENTTDGPVIIPIIDTYSEQLNDYAHYFLNIEEREINPTRLSYTTDGLENKREIALVVPTIVSWGSDDSVHFGDAGEGRAVAWIRFGDAKDAEDNSLLVIDEIQSNRHQEGREKGYGTEKGVPAAPFEKNWYELAMKRMLRFAAENGYDKVAWTTGEQQADRYDLGKVIERIDVTPWFNDIDTGQEVRVATVHPNNASEMFYRYDREGRIVSVDGLEEGNEEAQTLADIVGKDMAKTLVSTEERVIKGDGLRVGYDGMKGFYDEILPRFMQKYGKKWGAQVGEVTMPQLAERSQTMHAVDITPEMRESVLDGQPMFSISAPRIDLGTIAVKPGETKLEYAKRISETVKNMTPRNTSLDDAIRFSITVNHNSPYLLKKADGSFVDPETGERLGFDHRFMGKGEGGQAHGWGSYFSVHDLSRYAYNPSDINYTQPARHHYTVEIPDNNGENYLDEMKTLPKPLRRKIAAAVRELPGEPLQSVKYVNYTGGWNQLADMIERNQWAYLEIRDRLFNAFGGYPIDSEKRLSKLMGSLGFVGIHYDGHRDGECYVIFDENDAKIVDHIRFSITGKKTPTLLDDEQKKEAREKLTITKPIDAMVGVIKAENETSARKAAEEWAKENIPEPLHYQTEVGDVIIDLTSIKKSLGHGYSQAKLDAIPTLPEGFKAATYLGSMPDFDGQPIDNHFFAYPINYNGELCYVFCRARKDANTNRLYVHEVFVADKIKSSTLQTAAKLLRSKPHRGTALYREILSDILFDRKGTTNISNTQEKSEKNAEKSDFVDEYIRFSIVSDPKKVEELEDGEKIKVYRAMQMRDGKLYPPMAGRINREWQSPIELGKWEQADEHPELVNEKGKFILDKGNGSSGMPVAYNPYIHTSRSPLNDQFSSAWNRPELVTVEVEIPASELTSGYHAEKAKDAVGEIDWKSGDVSTKLAELGRPRKVILSRYDKPLRVIPDEEVAARIADMLKGTDIVIPFNTVTPSLRQALVAKGVKIGEPTKGNAGEASKKAYKEWEESGKVLLSTGTDDKKPDGDNTLVLYYQELWNEAETDERRDAVLNEFITRIMGDSVRFLVSRDRDEMYQFLLDNGYSEELAEQNLKYALSKGFHGWRLIGGAILLNGEKVNSMEHAREVIVHEMQHTNNKGQNGVKMLSDTITNSTPMELAYFLRVTRNGKNSYDHLLENGASGFYTLAEEVIAYGVQFCYEAPAGVDIKQYLRDKGIYNDAIINIIYDEYERQRQSNPYFNQQHRWWSADSYNDVRNGERRGADERADGKESENGYGRRAGGGTQVSGRREEYWQYDPKELAQLRDEAIKVANIAISDEQSMKIIAGQSNLYADDVRFSIGGDMSRNDVVTQVIVNQSKENYQLMRVALRRVGGELKKLEEAMRMQADFDRNQVVALLNLTNTLMRSHGWGTYMPSTIGTIITQIRNAIGKADISKEVGKIMDYLVDAQAHNARDRWNELRNTRIEKLNISGVVSQGKVAVEGQHALRALNEALYSRMTIDQLDEQIAVLADMLDNAKDNSMRMQYRGKLIGYVIAAQHLERIEHLLQERQQLNDELEANRSNKALTQKARQQQEEAIRKALRENNLNQADAFMESSKNLQEYITAQHAAAKDFIDKQNANREKIREYAAKDLAGKATDPNRLRTKGQVARQIWDAFSSPIRDMQSMLRLLGMHAPDGEGYLYNHFMRGWTDAADTERRGIVAAQQTLDAKISELTNGKYKTWEEAATDIKSKSHGLFSIEMLNGIDGNGNPVTETLSLDAGNALYIYAVNKMTDGQMKLRGMNITEEGVQALVDAVREKYGKELLDVVDWVQQDFFSQLRNRYNPTHEALFGAPMDAIENYFPLRINANVRQQNEDLGDPDTDAARLLTGTSTGAIKRRTKNSLALDVRNADFFQEVIRHISQMERWNAFAQWTRDANILFSDINFRNRVKGLKTIYGTGDKLYNYMKDAFKVAVGTYRPKTDTFSEITLNMAKGVTSAKINFRIFTALKQIASFPAFFTYMTDGAFVASYMRNWMKPHETMKWAKENLPNFEKRVSKRDMGDMRLMQRSTDWQWNKRILEWSSKYGMFFNVLFDTLTCATGARAVYDSHKADYLRKGYAEADAERRAIEDAEQAFNTSQQSSEGAYMAPVQQDRNLITAALTVFRTSPIQYTRNFFFHARNLVRKMQQGTKAEQIEFRRQQYLADGLTDEQATEAAARDYNKSIATDAVGLVVYGALLNILWRIAGQIPYLLMGDDDDKKKEILENSPKGGALVSPITGLLGGGIVESAIDGNGSIADMFAPEMPFTQDLKKVFQYISNEKYAEAASQALSVLMQSGTGFDPQTAAELVLRTLTTLDSDAELDAAQEAWQVTAAVLSIPQSQYEQMLIDRVIADASQYGAVLNDYIRYQKIRTAPLTWYLRNEEADWKAEKAARTRLNRLLKERRELKETED